MVISWLNPTKTVNDLKLGSVFGLQRPAPRASPLPEDAHSGQDREVL